jgi:hypothetical protein
MSLLRDPIKYVRDRAKGRYKKGTECEICGATENLDFHHYYSMTPMFNLWCKKNKIVIRTEEDILAVRDRFIEEKSAEVYDLTVTLCHDHHMALHAVYGKNPVLGTAKKQMTWVEKQRQKHLGE